ncbi:MAG: helix-turn-helix transcriptional regulator [Bacteroidota bacterium]
MYSKELLKGTLKTIILRMLADHGRMYGYELSQKVKQLSDGTLLLTEGALYPALHKLEAEGLVVTEKENIGKRVRKYYALTPKGKTAGQKKVQELEMFFQVLRQVLNLKPNAFKA